jgi:hypothetical protein
VFHLSLAERKFRRALMLIQFSPVGETRAVVPPAVVNFYYLPFYIKISEKEKPTSQEFPLFLFYGSTCALGSRGKIIPRHDALGKRLFELVETSIKQSLRREGPPKKFYCLYEC